MPASLPSYLHKYFWDVDAKKINPKDRPLFVIQRLLDKGDEKGVSWVLANFDRKQIKKAFKTLRDFDPKVGNFWKLFLHIPEREVACLQRHYRRMRKSHWPY